jgi:hypothetical protein
MWRMEKVLLRETNLKGRVYTNGVFPIRDGAPCVLLPRRTLDMAPENQLAEVIARAALAVNMQLAGTSWNQISPSPEFGDSIVSMRMNRWLTEVPSMAKLI